VETLKLYLDTHIVIWLYEGKFNRFSKHVLSLMANSELFISPLISLELAYLHEIRRINTPSHQMIDTLSQEIGLKICDLPFSQVIQSAVQQTWTRDPFDRIIVGQAMVNQCPLVTKDLLIHTHYVHAIWD
jgi:PIN domain nuclease of toxin-antitoxin system